MYIGLGTVFRSEKIPRNRLGTVSVIPRKKALIPRHSEFRGIANSEVRNGTEWNSAEKISFTKQQQKTELNDLSVVVFSDTIHGIPRVCFYFLLHGKEFRIVFSSAEWFGTEFREFASFLVPRKSHPLPAVSTN